MKSSLAMRLQALFRSAPVFFILSASVALAQESVALTPALRGKIDAAVHQVLSATGVPSASVAVVREARITYLQAYGDARLAPHLPATTAMRYSIGSISKQFTATAVLMLAEQGKLALDDPVARFLPDLTRAKEVTIRQVLSHTAGYQDYWPQDYVTPFMLQPVSAEGILERWARKPLDFAPGSDWQYSNTGYVIAGLIVEHASGQALVEFLRQHIFTPLGMSSVLDVDQGRLGETDATGYMRYGLGPLRAAPKEGKGWLFAAGELAMSAEDLAKWDISLIQQKLLTPASYRQMESSTLFNDGIAFNYGLGVAVRRESSHRSIAHSGEISGFSADNIIYPDDRVAVVVLTNQDAAGAADPLARKIARLLLPEEDATNEERQARGILEGLRHGKIDRALFSDNANFYFSESALNDVAAGLKPLGKPRSVTQTARRERGGMTFRQFLVRFPHKNVRILQRTLPNGIIEQYQLIAAE